MMMSVVLKPFAEASPRHFANPRSWRAGQDPQPFVELLPHEMTAAAELEISAWPGYRPSPLVSLSGLAAAAAVGGIHYKDESGRFGLGSFKARCEEVGFQNAVKKRDGGTIGF